MVYYYCRRRTTPTQPTPINPKRVNLGKKKKRGIEIVIGIGLSLTCIDDQYNDCTRL